MMTSSHTDNLKNNSLGLREGDTFGINGSFGAPEKKFSINFSKANTNIILIIAICLLTEKKYFKFKADNKNVNFPGQFCLGSISNEFSATDFREVSLNENVYAFSVDYNSIDKSDILNIHKCSITKNNIK